jgi:RHS repeat-associated protein
VGNRLTETTLAATTVYTYDNANRLTNVGAITYTWDNNGNLLADGVYTYTYDSANRPTTIINQQSPITNTFFYNGDGARLKQTVNGTPTTYTVDLAAGLTQVLVDVTSGVTNTYEYGNGRIAQNNSGSGTNYFLGDALGSVRQLTDSNGNVTLTKSYQPYGGMLSSSGSGSSAYGFTGEWMDNTGLMYLRARYYAPGVGRFISKDSWAGDYNRPLTLNRWNYSLSNPINYTDPTGHYAKEIHYRVTLQLGRTIGRSYCHGQTCAYSDKIAQLIARGNFHMDEPGLYANPFGGHPELHFVDQPIAHRNAAAAVRLQEPYLLGAALHQVQDWYTHWNEGYRWPGTVGHAPDSLRAGCTGSGPCHRSQDVIDAFYEKHPRSGFDLLGIYSSALINNISDDKLIDLWLQEFTQPGAGERGPQGYGYDTDYFFGFTARDKEMQHETSHWLEKFFRQLALDPCASANLITGYTPPKNEKIVEFLNSGEYRP